MLVLWKKINKIDGPVDRLNKRGLKFLKSTLKRLSTNLSEIERSTRECCTGNKADNLVKWTISHGNTKNCN